MHITQMVSKWEEESFISSANSENGLGCNMCGLPSGIKLDALTTTAANQW